MKKNRVIKITFIILSTILITLFFLTLISRFNEFNYILKNFLLYPVIILESFFVSIILVFLFNSYRRFRKNIFGEHLKFQIVSFLVMNVFFIFLIFTFSNLIVNFFPDQKNVLFKSNNNLIEVQKIYLDKVNKNNEIIRELIYKESYKSLEKYVDILYLKKSNKVIINNSNDIIGKFKTLVESLNKKNSLESMIINKKTYLYINSDKLLVFLKPKNDVYYLYFKISNLLDYNESIMLFEKLKPILYIILYIILIIPIVLLQIVIAMKFVKSLIKPLNLLIKGFENISSDDYEVIDLKKKNNELYFMIDKFNEMQSEIKRNRIYTKYKEQYEVYKRLTSKLAHDIKNPLTPIKISTELIAKKYPYKDDYKTYIDGKVKIIIDNIDIIKDKIEKIYSIDSMSNKKDIKNINLIDLLNNIKSVYESEHLIIYIYSDSNDYNLDWNYEDLSSIFMNLIINSYSAKKNNLEINIILKEKNNNYVIDYYDNGPGISEEIVNLIFKPFFTTKKEGTGLGLSIIKNILENYKSEINYLNDNDGAHFQMIIRR